MENKEEDQVYALRTNRILMNFGQSRYTLPRKDVVRFLPHPKTML